MIVELTLICTFIFHHLLLGLFIGGGLWLLFKMPWNIAPQARALLWLTSYLLITLLPFSAFLPSDKPTDTANVTSQNQQLLDSSTTKPITVNQTTLHRVDDSWHVPQSTIKAFAPLLALLMLVWIVGILWRSVQLVFKLINSW
ncbi:MAG: hypothetical protein ACI8WB_004892, partial [Phenylobacterium sp.]